MESRYPQRLPSPHGRNAFRVPPRDWRWIGLGGVGGEIENQGGGWGGNRTPDTRIFSPLLCQLSYPAVEGMEKISRRIGDDKKDGGKIFRSALADQLLPSEWHGCRTAGCGEMSFPCRASGTKRFSTSAGRLAVAGRIGRSAFPEKQNAEGFLLRRFERDLLREQT